MGWIKTDHKFGFRERILTLSSRGGKIRDKVTRAIDENCGNPEKLEEAVMAVVLLARPELAGCTLYAMNFDIWSQQWEFGIAHGSFAVSMPGEMPPKEPLFRESNAN